MRHFLYTAVAFCGLSNVCLGEFLGPSAYLSFADSPFAGETFDYFHLEDLEDAALNTPGLSASAGAAVGPGGNVDSVDGDDGAIDGDGGGGHSWFTLQQVSTVRFDFDPSALGDWPTHAGLVWTDVGISDPDFGFGDVIFEAFDTDGFSLGTLGPALVGDGDVMGGTAEDRFFGIVHAGGLSAIQLTMTESDDFELDHVQYGRIPEPATMLLLFAAVAVARPNR